MSAPLRILAQGDELALQTFAERIVADAEEIARSPGRGHWTAWADPERETRIQEAATATGVEVEIEELT